MKHLKSSMHSAYSPGRRSNRQKSIQNDQNYSQNSDRPDFIEHMQISQLLPITKQLRAPSNHGKSMQHSNYRIRNSSIVSDYRVDQSAAGADQNRKSSRTIIHIAVKEERLMKKLNTPKMMGEKLEDGGFTKVRAHESSAFSSRRLISHEGRSSSNSIRMN